MSLRDQLWQVTKKLPSDFEPWGERDREGGPSGQESTGDCSSGCRFFVPLDGKLGNDWGVCTNADSPRSGLLTFEHQGCPQFDYGNEEDRCGHCGIRREEALEVRGDHWESGSLCESCRKSGK